MLKSAPSGKEELNRRHARALSVSFERPLSPSWTSPQLTTTSQVRFLSLQVFVTYCANATTKPVLATGVGTVVISIEPGRYATYVYLPMCSTRSGRPLLATSGPPSSLLLVLDLAPRVFALCSSLLFILHHVLIASAGNIIKVQACRNMQNRHERRHPFLKLVPRSAHLPSQ